MDNGMQPASTSASALASWERWIDSVFVWLPYATLAASLIISQFGSAPASDRVADIGLAGAAAVWTWLTFTRQGRPTEVPKERLWVYFIGFIVVAAALMTRSPVFLVYGLTGFFHGSLLRPWSVAFLGIAATGFVIHSHIIITENTPTTWAIYVGVVAIQTVAVSAGLYAGQKLVEIAEERRRTVEQLELTMAENAGLHDQLIAQAREAGVLDERQRMAREIHDTIAQGLTGVITQIEAIQQSWGDEADVRRRLDITARLARDSLAEARRSVQAIRPTPLDDSRLPQALGDVAAKWSEVTNVPVQVHTTGDPRPLHPEVEVVLLRTAQEALANVAKHADASRVGLTLTFLDDSVALDVRDDGAGFDPAAVLGEQSFGLAAMQQRIDNVHGVMQVESTPGEGTALSVRITTTTVGSAHE